MSRRTGKTFKMLGEAVAAAAAGKSVIIVAHSYDYARSLAERVRAGLKAMGADMQLVHVRACLDPMLDEMRGDEYVVLRDHHGGQ